MAVGKAARGTSNMRFLNTSENSYGEVMPTKVWNVDGGTDSCMLVGSERGEPFSLEVDNGADMTVEAVSSRGTEVSYNFSLKGVTAALRQSKSLCG